MRQSPKAPAQAALSGTGAYGDIGDIGRADEVTQGRPSVFFFVFYRLLLCPTHEVRPLSEEGPGDL